ncbi:MAG: ATP-binding protein, partial [Elusimicrobiota bacterium]
AGLEAELERDLRARMEVESEARRKELERRADEDVRERVRTTEAELKKREEVLDRRAAKLASSEEELRSRQAEVRELRDRMLTSFRGESAQGRIPQEAFESELNDLVFGIAHQIRNPLGIVQSLAEDRLSRRFIGSGERRSMEAVLRAVGNLRERLAQLVDFTRPLGLSMKPVEAGDLLAAVRSEVAAQCEAKGIRVVTGPSEGVGRLRGDAEKLKEALLQLALNAVEAMPSGGTLTLAAGAGREGKGVALSVSDTGAGLAPEHVKEVGRPFFTTKPGGVGLGVAIAKRIAKAHGGGFAFRSTPGAGSTAVLDLPSAGHSAGKRS